MGVRDGDSTPTSHYAVLGVSRLATPTEIKHAYRAKAKAAHPDAGGSVAAMARVNEAYKVLGDPVARRSYDGSGPGVTRQGPPRPRRHQNPARPPEPVESDSPEAEYVTAHPRGAQPFETVTPEHISRSRAAWARNSAWELLRFSLPTTFLAVFAKAYLASQITGFGPSLAFELVTFLPVYALVLSVLFLVDPALRLVFADLVRRYPTTQVERRNALALVAAFFPLALAWILWG